MANEVVKRLDKLENKMDTHLNESAGIHAALATISTHVQWLSRGFWWLVGGGMLFNIGLAGLILLLWLRK